MTDFGPLPSMDDTDNAPTAEEAARQMMALLADYCLAVAREAGDRRVRYCDMTEELREAH